MQTTSGVNRRGHSAFGATRGFLLTSQGGNEQWQLGVGVKIFVLLNTVSRKMGEELTRWHTVQHLTHFLKLLPKDITFFRANEILQPARVSAGTTYQELQVCGLSLGRWEKGSQVSEKVEPHGGSQEESSHGMEKNKPGGQLGIWALSIPVECITMQTSVPAIHILEESGKALQEMPWKPVRLVLLLLLGFFFLSLVSMKVEGWCHFQSPPDGSMHRTSVL